jgi:hypothetical protein
MRRAHRRRPAVLIFHSWTIPQPARRDHLSAPLVSTMRWMPFPWPRRTLPRLTDTPSDDSRLPTPHLRRDAYQRSKKRTLVFAGTSVWTFAGRSLRGARRTRSIKCMLPSMLPRRRLLSCGITSARSSRAVLAPNKLACHWITGIRQIARQDSVGNRQTLLCKLGVQAFWLSNTHHVTDRVTVWAILNLILHISRLPAGSHCDATAFQKASASSPGIDAHDVISTSCCALFFSRLFRHINYEIK